ncbi:MAG: HDOD domain-containing protein [Planctomycetota bacterium]
MAVQTADKSKSIVSKAIASLGDIATLPEVTIKIIDVVEDADSTADDLQEVIKRDPALSAKILRVVNSAFYGLPGQVADVERASLLLGGVAVKNIAVAASLAKMFDGRQYPNLFPAKELWRHSIAVGVAAKRFTEVVGNPAGGDEFFLAGLIHDLGLLVERQVFPEELGEVCRRCNAGEGNFSQLEQEIIGATHQAFGEALTAQWRFPKSLQVAAGYHHSPQNLPDDFRSIGMILQTADILCCQEELGLNLTAKDQEITQDLLDATGASTDQLEEVRGDLAEKLDKAEAAFDAKD